ncbi:MAG: type II toxin-antitoxin system Phd/YefM family antitoxin [Phenylobacterium sp.]
MPQYSVRDAKTHLSRLISRALAGEEVVIVRGSKPVVRLEPIHLPGRRQFGLLKGRIAMDSRFDEPLPPDELAGWTRSTGC